MLHHRDRRTQKTPDRGPIGPQRLAVLEAQRGWKHVALLGSKERTDPQGATKGPSCCGCIARGGTQWTPPQRRTTILQSITGKRFSSVFRVGKSFWEFWINCQYIVSELALNYISIPYTGCLKRIQVAGKPSNLNCSTGDRYPRLICQCALRTLPARPTLKAVGPKSNDTQSTGLLIHEKDKRKSRLKSQDFIHLIFAPLAQRLHCPSYSTRLRTLSPSSQTWSVALPAPSPCAESLGRCWRPHSSCDQRADTRTPAGEDTEAGQKESRGLSGAGAPGCPEFLGRCQGCLDRFDLPRRIWWNVRAEDLPCHFLSGCHASDNVWIDWDDLGVRLDDQSLMANLDFTSYYRVYKWQAVDHKLLMCQVYCRSTYYLMQASSV